MIGVFDSGHGGLTVFRTLVGRFPRIPFVYLGDHHNVPYGNRASDEIVALTRHAFQELGMHRVFAIPFAHNKASCRVLEKVGFVLEGTMRRSAIKDGTLYDQYLYAAYDDTWPGRFTASSQ